VLAHLSLPHQRRRPRRPIAQLLYGLNLLVSPLLPQGVSAGLTRCLHDHNVVLCYCSPLSSLRGSHSRPFPPLALRAKDQGFKSRKGQLAWARTPALPELGPATESCRPILCPFPGTSASNACPGRRLSPSGCEGSVPASYLIFLLLILDYCVPWGRR